MSPWLLAIASTAALALCTAFFPVYSVFLIQTLAIAVYLVWRFKTHTGLWLLFVVSIPLRKPLSFEFYGTASIFYSDILLFVLTCMIAWKHGFLEIYRRSFVIKIGIGIFLISLIGMYSATRIYFGIVSIYELGGALLVFYVARNLIHNERDVYRTLLALLVGLVPAIIYGLYQASLPFDAPLPDWSFRHSAYSFAGEPRIRVFSTLASPLRFSTLLSVGFGMAIGLLSTGLGRGWKLFLFIFCIAAAVCNVFTYSLSGIVGMISAGIAILFMHRRNRVVLFLPLSLIVLMLAAPEPLVRKFEHVFSGESNASMARLLTYQQSYRILTENPLLGVGWGGYGTAMKETYRMARSPILSFVAENYFLHRGVALGIPGLILYIALMVLFIRNTLGLGSRVKLGEKWPRTCILAAGVAFYAQGQFIPAWFPSGIYYLWLLFAIAERMREVYRRESLLDAPMTESGMDKR